MAAALALMLGGCSATAPKQALPDGLEKLIGARGRDGETGLLQAGYQHRSTSKTETSSLARWRGRDGGCIEVTTTDGRYAKITPVAASLCDDNGSAVAPSGNAKAMRTVCGVIVGGKTSRYLCEVEENRQGTTVMRLPDTTIRLGWKPGGKLEFAQEGTASREVKYSESEGETDIFVDERTFFYISNPQAAELEVKNFRQ